MNEGRSTISSSGRGKRNSLWPTGSAINNCKEMGVARGRGKGANKINMDMGKTLGRNRDMLRRKVNMSVSFGRLAGQTGMAPGSNVPG